MVKPGFWMLRDQFARLPKASSHKADLSGRTVIVTGANIGLGYEATKHFARMNPGKLILACRSQQKGDAAIESIRKETGFQNMECWTVDFGDFKSVSAFADRFEESGLRLDLLVENAGVHLYHPERTNDGWETTIQVNHLATALLALRLLPKLLEAPASPPTPRLVIVSSMVHHFVKFETAAGPDILKRLNMPEPPSAFEGLDTRYQVSKLFNIFFVRALVARLHKPGPLTINTVNPAFCRSSLGRERVGNWDWWILQTFFARTTEMGSRTLVHAAVGKNVQGKTGEYLDTCRVGEVDDFVLSEEGHQMENQLWDETLYVLAKVDPKVLQIVEKYLS